MPLDPSIIGRGSQPAPMQNPLEALQTIAQLQGVREQTEARRLAGEKARQQAADDAAIRRVMTEAGGDWEKALPQLRTINPAAAAKLEADVADARNKTLDGASKSLANTKSVLDVGINAVRGATPENWPHVRAMVLALPGAQQTLAPLLPETFDPVVHERLLTLAVSRKDQLDQQEQAVKHFASGDVYRAIATGLAAVRPEDGQAGFDRVFASADALHAPASIVAQFQGVRQYSPETVAWAKQQALSPEKQAELAGQTATRAQTQAHQAVLEGQGAERIRIARQRLAQGTGSSQDQSALMQAVIDNPGLWDQITPTERGKIAGALNAKGFTGFGKPLSDAAVKQISDSQSAIASLKDLREVLKKNEQYIGPIAGLQALYPYSEANKAQADIDRVRQRVGKALEGGVLRKEDEEKYKKILATLRDVPETALYKVDQLTQDIQRDIDTYTHQQRLAGRRVPQETAPRIGERRTFNGRVGEWDGRGWRAVP